MLSTQAKFANESRIGMKWRISEDRLKESLKDSKCIISDTFNVSTIPGLQYHLFLEEKNPSQVFVFLALTLEMAKKVDAKFTIAVKSAARIKKSDRVYEKSTGWGKQLCTRDELFDSEKKFFVDGYMEVELDGTLNAPGGIKRKASESLSLAQLLWEREDDKDVVIFVDEQQIKIHKWVLCSRSPVFYAEMGSEFKEAKENKIKISDFCFETVKIAVDHFYERDINDQITAKNAYELLRFADKYDVEPLHNLIQNLLIDKLSEENVCAFANMSITSNALQLRECCISFLMKFVGKSALIDGFAKLDKEITSEIGQRSFLSTSLSE